jgi:hypothetical protein
MAVGSEVSRYVPYVGDCVIEVWQHRFVLAADPGGVEYDAGQIDGLMVARFKKRCAT